MQNPDSIGKSTLSRSGKVESKDKKIEFDLKDSKLSNHLFVRLVAKGRRFENVNFKYSTFDACYLRNCAFDSCDFTGCRFVSTNMHGSNFTGCKFEYASFEKTDIDDDVLATGCPGPENQKLRFARSLRMNYQQLGDAASVNKAIGVELNATERHLFKSWHSNESYYRNKYKKERRAQQFLRWANFKLLDLVWGNGESSWKLLRAVIVTLVVMTIADVQFFRDSSLVSNYFKSFVMAPQVFLGTLDPDEYSSAYLTLVMFLRLVFFGFFMSIVLKRFNRR